MEPIKIVDKLTLRQEALRMAIATGTSYPISEARQFEAYLLDDADLPEYVDPNADKQQWVDMLNKMREEMKPNPWISVDSEMKPAKGAEVLCALRYTSNIEYVVMSYNPEEKVWYGGNDDDNGNHVVGWMPIPPFVEPLKL